MPESPREKKPKAALPVTQPDAPSAGSVRLARLLPRVERLGLVVFVAMSFVSLAATLAWALSTMRARPLDGVEGEIIFEAMRLREKHALYIDPVLGDPSTGDPATRYFVLYPPVFSWLVSLFPFSSISSATVLVRAVALASWFFAVYAVARRGKWEGASPRTRARLLLVLGGAAFVLGTYTLTLFGAAGRPDAFALLLAALGLSRAVNKGKVDWLAGVVFAVAVFVKPNVLGLATGALTASMVRHRAQSWKGLASFGVAALVVFVTLHVASGGQMLTHLVASTAQDTSSALWFSQMGSRLPFFLAPILLGLALGIRNFKDDHTFVAFAALAASFAWAALSLSKIGSASNYWMEPCLAALCILSRAPDLSLGDASPLAAVVLAVQAPYDGVASIKSSLEGMSEAPQKRALLEGIRATCNESASFVTLADEPGIELEIDQRAIDTPFQFSHTKNEALSRAWIASLSSPNVRCLVMQNDLLERVGDDDPVHDRFSAAAKSALRERFRLEKNDAGFYIYRAR